MDMVQSLCNVHCGITKLLESALVIQKKLKQLHMYFDILGSKFHLSFFIIILTVCSDDYNVAFLLADRNVQVA